MTLKTIEYIQPEPREWEGPNGNVYFVSVNFEDGSEGSIGFRKENLEAGKESLRALRDKATEFELEDKGEYNGQRQWKIKSYPGKPAGGGSGARGGGGGMSHSQAGLLAAASALGPWIAHKGVGGELDMANAALQVMEMGEMLTQHLYDRKPPAQESSEGAEAESSTPATSASVPSDSLTLAQMKSLKEIASANGQTPEEFAQKMGVSSLASLSTDDAADVIAAYSKVGA